ncbi:MAG: hypothetical protein QF662_01780 [Phycisphaerae bacterium]|jgi:uncharacterized protein YutE (UPF0331/DUF86 family)|nr:hypothetical protein [Phycisphaerae bacterium]
MADLRERVEAEFENIDTVLGQLQSVGEVAGLSPVMLAGVAALLHSLYNGLENVLKQIARARGLAVSSGAGWHQALLRSVTEVGVIDNSLQARLRPYLAFRHFFVHAYAVQLDPERISPLIDDAASLVAQFRESVDKAISGE